MVRDTLLPGQFGFERVEAGQPLARTRERLGPIPAHDHGASRAECHLGRVAGLASTGQRGPRVLIAVLFNRGIRGGIGRLGFLNRRLCRVNRGELLRQPLHGPVRRVIPRLGRHQPLGRGLRKLQVGREPISECDLFLISELALDATSGGARVLQLGQRRLMRLGERLDAGTVLARRRQPRLGRSEPARRSATAARPELRIGLLDPGTNGVEASSARDRADLAFQRGADVVTHQSVGRVDPKCTGLLDPEQPQSTARVAVRAAVVAALEAEQRLQLILRRVALEAPTRAGELHPMRAEELLLHLPALARHLEPDRDPGRHVVTDRAVGPGQLRPCGVADEQGRAQRFQQRRFARLVRLDDDVQARLEAVEPQRTAEAAKVVSALRPARS